MRRLSSSITFFYKRVFPLLWVGFVVVVIGLQLVAPQHARPDASPRPLIPLVLMPLFMVGVMFVIYRKLLHDLLDEVWLDGDWLVVKNRGEKIRVSLRDVMNVNATTMTNPRRITLMLRTDSRFGRQLAFTPAGRRGFMSGFKPDPVATDLIGRVDALRRVPG
jgi:hypothetical protein